MNAFDKHFGIRKGRAVVSPVCHKDKETKSVHSNQSALKQPPKNGLGGRKMNPNANFYYL